MSNTLGIGNFLKKARNYSTNTFLGTEKDGVRTGGYIDDTANRLFKEGDVPEGAVLKGLGILGKKATAAAATMKGLGAIGMGAVGALAGPLAMILAIKGSQAKRKQELEKKQNLLAIQPMPYHRIQA